MHTSYSSLGRDFKNIFEELVKHLNTQQTEADDLRRQLSIATATAMQAEERVAQQLEVLLEEERKQATDDRQTLLSQITDLINRTGSAQGERLNQKVQAVRTDLTAARADFQAADKKHGESMAIWSKKESLLIEEVLKSRDTLKGKMKKDWTAVNEHNTLIQTTTKSVHEQTVRIVDAQIRDTAIQMQALDDFVTRARSHNESHHTSQLKSLQGLATSVQESYASTQGHLRSSKERVHAHGKDITASSDTLRNTLAPLDSTIRQPLSDLREQILHAPLAEYISTGETPQKTQYQYPKTLPRTQPHEKLLACSPNSPTNAILSDPPEDIVSPSKSIVYTDAPDEDVALIRPASMDGGLREVHVNINAGVSRSAELLASVKPELETVSLLSSLMGPPPLKKRATMDSKLPRGGKAGLVKVEGRENAPLGGTRRLRSSPTG